MKRVFEMVKVLSLSAMLMAMYFGFYLIVGGAI